MRILLDYRPALVQRTGVGEYAHELAAALIPQLPPGDSLTLFSSSWRDRLEPDRLPGAWIVDARVPVYLLNLAWHRLEWPPVELLAGRADVCHSTRPMLIPSRKAAQVVTIHDLYFLDRPEGAPIEVRRDYPALVGDHARRADAVVVISKYTALQVETRLGVIAERIAICPPGAPAWPRRAQPRIVGPILYFGTIEPRKNVEALLGAYAKLTARRPETPSLVLAGRPPGDSSDVATALRRSPLAGRARHLGYVTNAERLRLFSEASMLVVPSLDEGFGMPALEAMTIGLPVVAADRGALPEVLGPAGLLVNPQDEEALAAAMQRMLDDPRLAEHATEQGFRRAAAYSWASSATRLREAYEAAVAIRRQRH